MPELKVMLRQQIGVRLVTIPPTEVPLLMISTFSKRVDEDVLVMIVNFLRCGCRAVQLMVDFVSEDYDYNEEFCQQMNAFLGDVAVDGESFELVVHSERKEHTFYLITRKPGA